ncbi:MAG: hypothetical protein AAFV93_22360 [Chloroflexota bacterium]
MSEQNREQITKNTWKTRMYILGGLLGAFMGFASAYLFAKEAEAEGDANEEKAPDIPAGALLSLLLAAVSLVRQIAETGSKKRKK